MNDKIIHILHKHIIRMLTQIFLMKCNMKNKCLVIVGIKYCFS